MHINLNLRPQHVKNIISSRWSLSESLSAPRPGRSSMTLHKPNPTSPTSHHATPQTQTSSLRARRNQTTPHEQQWSSESASPASASATRPSTTSWSHTRGTSPPKIKPQPSIVRVRTDAAIVLHAAPSPSRSLAPTTPSRSRRQRILAENLSRIYSWIRRAQSIGWVWARSRVSPFGGYFRW
jgi:hypothetical protein